MLFCGLTMITWIFVLLHIGYSSWWLPHGLRVLRGACDVSPCINSFVWLSFSLGDRWPLRPLRRPCQKKKSEIEPGYLLICWSQKLAMSSHAHAFFQQRAKRCVVGRASTRLRLQLWQIEFPFKNRTRKRACTGVLGQSCTTYKTSLRVVAQGWARDHHAPQPRGGCDIITRPSIAISPPSSSPSTPSVSTLSSAAASPHYHHHHHHHHHHPHPHHHQYQYHKL